MSQLQKYRDQEKKDKDREQTKFKSMGDAEMADADKVLHDMNKALGIETLTAQEVAPGGGIICCCRVEGCRIGPMQSY